MHSYILTPALPADETRWWHTQEPMVTFIVWITAPSAGSRRVVQGLGFRVRVNPRTLNPNPKLGSPLQVLVAVGWIHFWWIHIRGWHRVTHVVCAYSPRILIGLPSTYHTRIICIVLYNTITLCIQYHLCVWP
jgi:hypothetical protein